MQVILAGIGWHMVGAASGAAFYAPIGKVKKWSWETTWAIAGCCSRTFTVSMHRSMRAFFGRLLYSELCGALAM